MLRGAVQSLAASDRVRANGRGERPREDRLVGRRATIRRRWGRREVSRDVCDDHTVPEGVIATGSRSPVGDSRSPVGVDTRQTRQTRRAVRLACCRAQRSRRSSTRYWPVASGCCCAQFQGSIVVKGNRGIVEVTPQLDPVIAQVLQGLAEVTLGQDHLRRPLLKLGQPPFHGVPDRFGLRLAAPNARRPPTACPDPRCRTAAGTRAFLSCPTSIRAAASADRASDSAGVPPAPRPSLRTAARSPAGFRRAASRSATPVRGDRQLEFFHCVGQPRRRVRFTSFAATTLV